MSNAQATGRVQWFDLDKGFGFIEITECDDKEYVGKDIFCHVSDVKGDPLRAEDKVDFEVLPDEKASRGDKLRAAQVTGGTGSFNDRRAPKGRGRGDSRRRGGGGGGRGRDSRRRGGGGGGGRKDSRSRGRGGRGGGRDSRRR